MRRVVLTALPCLVLCFGAGPRAQAPSVQADDCFANLTTGRSSEIICQFPLRPSDAERKELEALTRGYLKDVTCKVAIRIERAQVRAAIDTPDTVFQSPPQPVSCNVTAAWSKAPTVIPIAATFAPVVTIKGGKAVDASPGLANVEGVPRPLSWPVEKWLNSGIGIKSEMLTIINAWLDYMRRNRARPA
jgi:hypothetical protein